MTEEKLDTLSTLFQDYVPMKQDSRDFYLEILTTCNGSVYEAVQIINDTLGTNKVCECNDKKRKCESTAVAKIQKDLNFFIKDNSNKLKKRRVDPNVKVSRSAIELTNKEEIEAKIKYLTCDEDFLPTELANNLLAYLMEDTQDAKANVFYLFGKKCSQNVKVKSFSSNQDIIDGKLSIYYNSEKKTMKSYNDLLKITSLLVEDFVNEKIAKFDPLPFQVRSPNWKSDVVLVNRYENDGSLGWHSDRMTSIGPHPIIASLSLGCSREFNVRKNYPTNSQVYTLRPKHNSLIIMHAGFQEEYRHSVPPKTMKSKFIPNPISKNLRINLTYRYFLPKFVEFAPSCIKCESPMELRRCFKDPSKRGQYLWQCSSSYAGKECNGVRMANFNNKFLIVDEKFPKPSTWIADDDEAARKTKEYKE